MKMEVRFPGNLAVEAKVGNFVVRTDQPAAAGGDESAPSPYGLFLASLATCAGYFAVRFCRERDIDTEGMVLTASFERDSANHRLEKTSLHLTLPIGFPEKYKKAIIRAMDECTVKKAIQDPPAFEVTAE
jgi:ribosomal protein S12 methylthiotransferase accessory factor